MKSKELNSEFTMIPDHLFAILCHQLRRDMKLTQYEMARMLGFKSAQRVCEIENGKKVSGRIKRCLFYLQKFSVI